MSSILAPQPAKAITPEEQVIAVAVIASGPTFYGLYKFCQWVKSTKTGKTIAKGIGAVATGLGAGAAGLLAANYFSDARFYSMCGNKILRHEAEIDTLRATVISCGLGLTSCLLAESTIKGLTNTNQNNN